MGRKVCLHFPTFQNLEPFTFREQKANLNLAGQPVDYAWAAGILDGEGCIGLGKQQPKTNKRPTYSVYVEVVNTDPAMLTRLVEIFGVGRVYSKRAFKSHHRPRWSWRVVSKQAERVLRDVLPYLVTKRHQAELALLSRSMMTPRGGRVVNPNHMELERIEAELKAAKKVSGVL